MALPEPIVTERRGCLRIWRRADIPLGRVIEALETPGEVLKASWKGTVRRVGAWVVKETGPQRGLALLKLTLARGRYRRAWRAACFLAEQGVPVAAPLAYVERGWMGFVSGNAVLSEHLDGVRNVEARAADLARTGDAGAISGYLDALADAVNRLAATGAYHSDLSGKNILTRNGPPFYFVDLDGVILGRAYTDRLRMRNHIQLYDSFCDLFPEEPLRRFIARMLPPDAPGEPWIRAVQKGQYARRARLESRRARTRAKG